MQTKFEKTSTTLGTLKVEITEADYKTTVDKKIKEYSKTAVVKGFRAGNVPVQYIKNIYGKGILVDEVIKIASKAVNNTISENKLNAVGEPTPSDDSYNIDWTKQKEYTFNYTIGFASEFSVNVDALPSIVQYDIEPGPEQIASTIEDLKGRFGGEIEPETVALEDLVFGNLQQAETGFMFQSGIPVDKVVSSSQSVFLGLQKGSKVSFDIQSIFETARDLGFATGKSDEEAASLEGLFEFEVTKITRKTKGELNQEFFDKVLGPGKATDQASFEAELSQIMKDNYGRESDFLMTFDIDKLLLENIIIELPDAYLKEWLVEINKGKATAEDVEKEYSQIAKGLRLDFIKSEIAKQAEVKVEYQDVLEAVKTEIRGYFGGGGDFAGMEEFVEKMAKKQLEEKKQEETRKYFEKAFGEKIMAYLKTKVKTTTQQIGVDEFTELAKEKYQA